MKKSKSEQAVLLRIEREKYLQLRHELLDRRVSVNRFFNDLLGRHFSKKSEHKQEQAQ